MVLSPKKLLYLVRNKKLVENLGERELKNPEGAGFDLRVGEVYKIKGKAFLGINERHTPEVKLIKKYEKIRVSSFKIKPGDFYLVKTLESVNMPQNLTASITPRSTTYRSGIFIRAGNVPPGYRGELIFGLSNEGGVTVEIEMGARFVHIQFHEVWGGGSLYRGQWQGGRVNVKRLEKQV